MENTEVKKNKRVRHCYPRKELYHRWIHSDVYVHTPFKGIACSGVGNYLKIWKFYHNETNQDVIDNWLFNKSSIISIIDRNKKRILINKNYSQHCWNLESSLPDDFKIFYTNDIIENPLVLESDEEIYKTHLIYLIKNYVNSIINLYRIINNKDKLVHYDFNNNIYNEIKQFVDIYKIKKYDWYNKSLGKYYKEDLPTLKQIINRTIFSKKEKFKIEQHKFYTDYCNGNGIPLKWLKENWNKVPTKEEAIKFFDKKTIFKNQSEISIKDDNKETWNEIIIRYNKGYLNYIEKERERCKVLSKEYYNIALEKFNKLSNKECIVSDWRESINNNNAVKYKEFFPQSGKKIGYWVERVLNINNIRFDNIQLKLINNKHNIITSRHAIVPLNDAIDKFKFIMHYIKLLEDNKVKSHNFNNTNIGIYNLRFIKYTEKKTDKGENLNRNEWLIQIGCHSLWLDDILDFIHYYKLEKEFGLEEKKTLNLK